MEVVGEDVAPTALALHAGLYGDHLPMRSHRPDVLFPPDAGVASASQLLDVLFQLLHSGRWCGPPSMRCAERPVQG